MSFREDSPGQPASLGLPDAPSAAGNYVPVREIRGVLYVAGQTPHINGKQIQQGIVGDSVTIEQAQRLARVAAENALAALRHHLGSLDDIEAIASVTGYVACATDFEQQSVVIDGASQAIIDHLGERGRHARAAVGVSSLPAAAPVEVSIVAARRIKENG